VKENPSTARHRSGSKISETMAPIVADGWGPLPYRPGHGNERGGFLAVPTCAT
jgi:hypothetical protein